MKRKEILELLKDVAIFGGSVPSENIQEVRAFLESQIQDKELPTDECNRVEVIDDKGRSYVNWKPTNKVEISMQDDNRTMKIFISQAETKEENSTVMDLSGNNNHGTLTNKPDFYCLGVSIGEKKCKTQCKHCLEGERNDK